MEQKALQYLYSLGLIDQEIFEFKKSSKQLPIDIEQLEGELGVFSKKINFLENENDEINLIFPELNSRLEEAQAGYDKAESKISLIKTNEEYDKVYSERSTFKGIIKNVTNEKVKNNTRIEENENEIEELKIALAEKEAVLVPEIKKIKRKLNKVKKIIGTKLEDREVVLEKLQGVNGNLAKMYKENYKNSKTGIVVGFISDETSFCSNCYSNLPIQTLYDIRDGKDIAICENCGVLLVSNNFKIDEESVKNEVLKEEIGNE